MSEFEGAIEIEITKASYNVTVTLQNKSVLKRKSQVLDEIWQQAVLYSIYWDFSKDFL